MLTNLGKKKPGELSAYAIFNPGHKPLMGTLTADQIENQLRSGAGAVQQASASTQRDAFDGAGVGRRLGHGTDAPEDEVENAMLEAAIARSLVDNHAMKKRGKKKKGGVRR
jgi:hypothetical protein